MHKLLFVALNSDSSITNLKGENRPICPLESRLAIVSSISYIDFIMVFDEETPVKIHDILEPDIIVKGGDYSSQQIEKTFPNMKEFRSIPLVSNFSTTNIIKKIKDNY